MPLGLVVEMGSSAVPWVRMGPGSKVGSFLLGRLLGSGAAAKVYQAEHIVDGTSVALKILTPDAEINQNSDLESFAHEVRAVAGLNHERITAIYDHGIVTPAEAQGFSEYVGAPWLAMELVRGKTLSTLRGKVSWVELRQILTEVLDALAHAHARGVVHRDIKPANILLDAETRRIKLTDFGLARNRAAESFGAQEESDWISGTPAYMAPEQIKGDSTSVGPWTDVYSLGVLAWTLACGAPPYRGDLQTVLRAHLSGVLPPFEPVIAVPKGLMDWLLICLEVTARDRFTRAADAAWALTILPKTPGADDGFGAAGTAASHPLIDSNIAEYETLVFGQEAPTVSFDAPTLLLSEKNSLGGKATERGAPHTILRTAVSERPFPTEWRTGRRTRKHLHGAGLAMFHLRTSGVVGRSRERDLLWDTLRKVVDESKLRCVVIEGASGSGKRTLSRWLATRADELGCAQWRALQYDSTESTAAMSDILGWNVVLKRGSRADAVAYVERVLERLGIGSREDAIGLVELAQPSSDSETNAGLTAAFKSQKERLTLVSRYLRASACERPLIVLVDRLDENDAGLDLFEHFLNEEVEAPILLVATAASDKPQTDVRVAAKLDAVTAHERTECIRLAPMDNDALSGLIQELLGLDIQLADRVVERSGGNPQFAVQLVSDWITRGLLEPAESGFRLRPGADTSIPGGMLDLWRQRLERALSEHSDEELAGVELAALLGNEIDHSEWAEAMKLADVSPCSELMATLQAQRLIVYSPGGRDWAFVHALFREALLERVDECGRTARWASLLADSLRPGGANIGRRARLLVSADRTDEALEPLYESAIRESARGEQGRAMQLAAIRKTILKDFPVEPDGRHALQSKWLDIVLSDSKRKDATVLEAVPTLVPWAERCRAWRELAVIKGQESYALWIRGDKEQALMRSDEALALALEHRLREASAFLKNRCVYSIRMGNFDEAASIARDAIHIAESFGDSGEVGAAYYMLARVHWQQGDNDGARFLINEATLRFERVGSRLGLAQAFNTRGEIARACGEYAEAERAYLQATARYKSMGSHTHLISELNLGMVYVSSGRFADGRVLLTRLISGTNLPRSVGYILLARLARAACLAHAQEWDFLAQELDEVVEAYAKNPIYDSDLVRAAKLCGDQCDHHGRSDLGEKAWAIAIDQLENLGRNEEATAIRNRQTN